MAWKFTDRDIEDMKSELRAEGYTGPFYDADHVVSLYNALIVKPSGTYPGGKTK